MKALHDALLWRLIAIPLTGVVLLVNGMPLLETTSIALQTQAVLFLGQWCFNLWRFGSTSTNNPGL